MFKKLGHKIEVIIRWISIWITRFLRFFGHDIWFLNEQDFSRAKARLVRDGKTVTLMLNTFYTQKISYRAYAHLILIKRIHDLDSSCIPEDLKKVSKVL